MVKEQDFTPGPSWVQGFLSRYDDRIRAKLPAALDTSREKWQTVENFSWWYHCLGKFLVKYKFVHLAEEYTEMDVDDVMRVFPPEAPLYRWIQHLTQIKRA